MFIKKEGVNMKDMNALNHKLQTMTRKELETICKAHNCKINDENLSIAFKRFTTFKLFHLLKFIHIYYPIK
jgi:hypothetical protein